jgi:hypothetical protein
MVGCGAWKNFSIVAKSGSLLKQADCSSENRTLIILIYLIRAIRQISVLFHSWC